MSTDSKESPQPATGVSMSRNTALGTIVAALIAGGAIGYFVPKTPRAAAPAAVVQTGTDPVLATVNGEAIRQSDLDLADADIGQSLPGATGDAKREALLSYMIDVTILAQAASQKKLDGTADYAPRINYARNKVLMELLLNDVTKTSATEAEMKKIYDAEIAKLTPEDEVRARHILVKTVEEANDILAKLKAGADFEKLARELSIDPSAKTNGGDLEYFTKGQMVAEFSEAAFKLKKGELSEPVKSQFGFHIIKIEDRRTKPLPKFEEVKEQISAFVSRRAQADLVLKLRNEAKIENFVKKPTPPAAPAPEMKKEEKKEEPNKPEEKK